MLSPFQRLLAALGTRWLLAAPGDSWRLMAHSGGSWRSLAASFLAVSGEIKKLRSLSAFALADVRSYGAASKFALVAVKPFFFMVQHGMSFVGAVQASAPDVPSKEIIPKFQDDAGGVKHDCNQQ